MNEVNTKLVNAMEGETPVAHKHEGEHKHVAPKTAEVKQEHEVKTNEAHRM